jgi:hypothetical protein
MQIYFSIQLFHPQYLSHVQCIFYVNLSQCCCFLLNTGHSGSSARYSMFALLLSMFIVVWVANRLLGPPADWSSQSPREPPRSTSFAVYPYHLLPGEIDRFVCGNTLTCVWMKAADDEEHPVKMSSYYTPVWLRYLFHKRLSHSHL